ncbi:unnamed protein product, partial [Laminaria digitata]
AAADDDASSSLAKSSGASRWQSEHPQNVARLRQPDPPLPSYGALNPAAHLAATEMARQPPPPPVAPGAPGAPGPPGPPGAPGAPGAAEGSAPVSVSGLHPSFFTAAALSD